MRIAFCLNGINNIGGAERRLSRIFKKIHSEKYQITLILTKIDDELRVEETYRKFLGNKIEIVFLEMNNKRIFNYMKNSCFDIVCYIGPYRAMIPFLLGAKRSGSKCLWLLVNTYYSQYKFENFGQKLLYRICAFCSDNIDCLFPSSLAVVKKHTKKPVTITPCAFTDLNLFAPLEKEKTFAFVSRLTKGKNCDLFLRSIFLIKDKMIEKGYTAIVAGDGEELENLKKLCKMLNINDVVEFTGYVNPETILPKASVFLSLQDNNNYPSQSLIEAISCGCYIIATDIGDTRRIVNSDYGSLCTYNIDDIAAQMIAYMEYSSNHKMEIQYKARDFAINTFSVNNSVTHYKELFDKMNGGRNE